ncbi:Lon protease like, mitochondrial [Pseudolycoriella hygida]|uniref:Lon protease homolog n=1 Tax=Pseudolycoriella hygida TaxID=35572 RepID=A0A9Q0N2S0_9DIPT|nr:Lon protease like, mitochondrial [Pseudolycoriella hygida]
MSSLFPKAFRLFGRQSFPGLFSAKPDKFYRLPTKVVARNVTRTVQHSNQWLAAFDSRYGPRSKKFFEPNQTKKIGVPRKMPDAFAKVPVIAVDNAPIFPKFTKIIEITDGNLIDFVSKQLQANKMFFGVFLKKSSAQKSEVATDLNDIHRVGTFVHVKDMKIYGDRATLVVEGIRRIKVANEISERNSADWFLNDAKSSVLVVETQQFKSDRFQEDNQVKAISQEIVQTIRDIVSMKPLSTDLLEQILQQNQSVLNNVVYICDLGASLTNASPDELQNVMEETSIPERLMLTLQLLKKEMELTKLQAKIAQEVEAKIKQMHKKLMLMEQLKVVKKELGDDVLDKDTLAEQLREKLEGKEVPEIVLKTLDEEINKMKQVEGYGMDYNVSRNYLDWLTVLPWGVRTKENLCIDTAAKVLDADHFGMEAVKTRILEFMAVSKLRGTTQGKILCFHGPPGVGKTSIARSIANALNRKYYRFSVGGMTDVSQIKGHRRTYVGAMPGKIIQAMKLTNTENPLILIDEIDKIGTRSRLGGSDPSSAILELLDPEQNVEFLDHYMDIPVDVSKVLFICTANDIDNIPEPLKDRMEMIEMSSYISEEKLAIAKGYLIPKAMKENGLHEPQLKWESDALDQLVQNYCREAGVRGLQQQIEKIVRKVAFKIVKNEKNTETVTLDSLEAYLGSAPFSAALMYKETPPGVVMGLGSTAMGGTVLFIETTNKQLEENKQEQPAIHVTGNVGAVMKESVEIAYAVARNHLKAKDKENAFFDKNKIQLHIPKAATPKEGPSAGVTIVAALQSLALNRPVRQNVAMSGEVSLMGMILPVGGIKEKTIAAKRSDVKCLIFPDENKKDFEAIPKYITKEIEVHFVKTYADVHKILFDV